jgi:hypothetical protein
MIARGEREPAPPSEEKPAPHEPRIEQYRER